MSGGNPPPSPSQRLQALVVLVNPSPAMERAYRPFHLERGMRSRLHATRATGRPAGLSERLVVLLDELSNSPFFSGLLGGLMAYLVDVGSFSETPVSDCRGGFPTGRVEHSVSKGAGAFFNQVQGHDLAVIGHLGEIQDVYPQRTIRPKEEQRQRNEDTAVLPTSA